MIIFAKALHSPHEAIFFYVCGFAAVIGIGGSFCETKDPFPKTKNTPPYSYEVIGFKTSLKYSIE
jgi:hypothetical protein